jgi:hypothetical protein
VISPGRSSVLQRSSSRAAIASGIGVGPQIGYIFPVAGMQGYINLKGYGEFDNENRPAGWNAWPTFVLSPAPPAADKEPPPMLTKTPSHG